MSLLKPGAAEATDGLLKPAAATTRPAGAGLLWGAALLAAAAAAVLWWPTRPTPVARVRRPTHPCATSPASAASATEPAPAEVGRYEMLVATAGGSQARIADELAARCPPRANAMRVVPLSDGGDAIIGLKSPGRLAIARFDVLRAARGSAASALRVLTPLFRKRCCSSFAAIRR